MIRVKRGCENVGVALTNTLRNGNEYFWFGKLQTKDQGNRGPEAKLWSEGTEKNDCKFDFKFRGLNLSNLLHPLNLCAVYVTVP